MEHKSVILGMSGGVDSSVAALLLKEQGYKVIGVFMKNFSDTKNKFTGECWWREELDLARTIANKLDIELHVMDYESEYKNKVIRPMIRKYSKNDTPNPDVECNNLTKFPALLSAMRKFKADFIATGHYAQVKRLKGRFHIQQGKDRAKDQSYFLYKLTQRELSRVIFPLGKRTKEEVRRIAKRAGFPNHDKHGSAGVCFIGDQDLNSYLKAHIKARPGKVIDENNDIMGSHEGLQFYTIGQKAGEHFGIMINKPREKAQFRYYVARKLPNNILQVAPENHELLKTRQVKLPRLYSPSKARMGPGRYLARFRHLGPLVPGKLSKSGKSYLFTFAMPQEAIASGQSLVLYHGSSLIAGGEMSI